MRSPAYHHSMLSQNPTQHGDIEGARSKRCQAPRAVDKSWAPAQKLLFASSPPFNTIRLGDAGPPSIRRMYCFSLYTTLSRRVGPCPHPRFLSQRPKRAGEKATIAPLSTPRPGHYVWLLAITIVCTSTTTGITPKGLQYRRFAEPSGLPLSLAAVAHSHGGG